MLCFLDEMLLSRLLFLWQMLTCFLIRLITQIQSPFSCYVNLQGKKKTLPLSDSSHRLLNYVLRLYACLRRLSQRSGASRLNDLLFEVAAVATRSSCLFVRDQETTCASHFQPCWQCYRHKEGHEVAVVTLFMPV